MVVFRDFIVIIVRESDTIDVSNTKGGEMNKYQTVGVDSDEWVDDDDSDDYVIAEADCELSMIEGEKYEL